MARRGNIRALKVTLGAGSAVFGASAVVLYAVPRIFTDLLGLPGGDELDWAMRMISITLLALTGNMLIIAIRGTQNAVFAAARVMQFAAFGLGAVTLLIPAPISWFVISYAMVGFVFSGAYTLFLMSSRASSIDGNFDGDDTSGVQKDA